MASASEAVGATLGRTPTAADLADALGWPLEDVVEAQLARCSRTKVSLEDPLHESDDRQCVADRLGEVDPGYELVDSLCALEAAMPALRLTEKKVLRLRFEHDLKLHEIAQALGMPDAQASAVLASALRKLRHSVGAAAHPGCSYRNSHDRGRHSPSRRLLQHAGAAR